MKKTIQRTALVLGCFIGCALITGDMVAFGAGITAQENLKTLLETRSCKGCDLTRLNLNRMDLSGVDLEGADLSFTKLFLTNLAGANLQKTVLTGAQLGGADLGDADLRGADLRGTSLENAYLGGTLLDGEFVTTKPYESIGVTEIEKDVYVDDQTRPKKNPEKQEVKVGERRDFEEPPPQLTVAKSQPDEESVAAQGDQESLRSDAAPPEMTVPQPPAAKKVKPVDAVVIDEPKQSAPPDAAPVQVAAVKMDDTAPDRERNTDSAVVEKEQEIAVSPADEVEAVGETEQSVPAVPQPSKGRTTEMGSVVQAPEGNPDPAQKKGDKERVIAAGNDIAKVDLPQQQEEVSTPPPQDEKQVDDGQSNAGGQGSADPLAENTKSDNLARLLDKNRCYGCDLSGLDLAGKDFEGADLEGADLSQCNLNKADLQDANLKGANLQGADIRNADLRDADLYKANLTDADLTGAKMEGAMFDSAILTGAVGVDNQLLHTDK